MSAPDLSEAAVGLVDAQASLSFFLMDTRDGFRKWLAAGNARKYSPDVALSCMDKISDYALRKKLTTCSIWEYAQANAFSIVYDALLRIIDSNTRDVFITAGQLYLRFLKQKTLTQNEIIAAVPEEKEAEPVIVAYEYKQEDIDANDVVAWLLTQPNANGTLYLEHVVRTYMSALRKAPQKLILQHSQSRNVFGCHTVADFDELWVTFKAAPNYVEVNRTLWRGQLSAGLAVYRRYMEHLENNEDASSAGAMPIELALKEAAASGTQSAFELEEGAAGLVQSQPAYITSAKEQQPTFDPVILKQLTDVLATRFSNGYRLDSPLEMKRFRKFVATDSGKELTLSDEELKAYVTACGTTYEDKVYAVSTETEERIKKLAADYFADGSGAQVIFFVELYDKNRDWLSGASIVSEDMLITLLRRLFPKLSFTQTYFGYTKASISDTVEDEILRVWGADVLLTYSQLAERLPYIPLKRIKDTLCRKNDFICNGVGTFSHISRIDITDEEREAIRTTTTEECDAHRYVSIIDLPYHEMKERNSELSSTALHDAIYHICLSDKFDKHGKIISRKGDVFDLRTIVREYCRTIDKCSLDDLLSYEKKLTGERRYHVPTEAANSGLVRIDRDTYVADKYVSFNVELIDDAIELVVEGNYLPLKSFTTFGAFPDCGHTWNPFLLESYCRHFSRKFRFDSPAANSLNAGAVIRKNCTMAYTEIMTDAVANADVLLEGRSVGCFLFDNGYTGKKTNANIKKIIDAAKTMRKRGN